MQPAVIRLHYRQAIDAATAQEPLWQGVCRASHDEFLLKSQAYNPEGRHQLFSEMVAADGRANSLHYKCSFPIGPYIAQLSGIIPELRDNAGNPLKFSSWEHRLIESDLRTPYAHRISITWLTGALTLLGTVQDFLLLAPGDRIAALAAGEAIDDCFTLQLKPGISIASFRLHAAPAAHSAQADDAVLS